MRRVGQLDEYGCGVACVAMVAGVSYEEAKQALFPLKKVSRTTHKQLRSALTRFGFLLGDRKSLKGVHYDDLSRNCLIWARIDAGKDSWRHWMVWDAESQAILDPYNGEELHRKFIRLLAVFEIF